MRYIFYWAIKRRMPSVFERRTSIPGLRLFCKSDKIFPGQKTLNPARRNTATPQSSFSFPPLVQGGYSQGHFFPSDIAESRTFHDGGKFTGTREIHHGSGKVLIGL